MSKGKIVQVIGSTLDAEYPKGQLPEIYDAIVADIKAGNPVGKDYTEFSFMKHGGNDIIFVEEGLPPDAIAAMEAKRQAIKDGSFEVPINPDEPS